MNVNSLIGRFLRLQVFCLATVTLFALVWSGFAFIDEIHYAAGHCDLEKVTPLLKDNPELISRRDAFGYTPLHDAALEGHKDMVELLLAKGADVNAKDKDGNTPLHEAAYTNDRGFVELLLAEGAEVNAKNSSGSTPLRWALFGPRQGPLRIDTDTVELLRQHGGHE